MNSFISGAAFMGFCTASFYFYRFWKLSGDRLFKKFSISFALLALERVILEGKYVHAEHQPYIFLVRLAASAVLVYGIWEKNWGTDRRSIRDLRRKWDEEEAGYFTS